MTIALNTAITLHALVTALLHNILLLHCLALAWDIPYIRKRFLNLVHMILIEVNFMCHNI